MMKRKLPTTKYTTHLLCIPLATTKTRPQIQMFLDTLRNHQATGAVPPTAWPTVDTCNIHLGRVEINSSDQLRTVCEGLKKFDVPSILGTELGHELSISLRGLYSNTAGKQRALTNTLYTKISNPRPLIILREALHEFFNSHGLMLGNQSSKEGLIGKRPTRVYVKILETEKTLSTNNFTPLAPVFDARGIYAAGRDSLWIDKLPLESICLRKRGIRSLVKDGIVIGQGFEDIFRVSLSNPAESAYEQNEPGVKRIELVQNKVAEVLEARSVIPSET